MSTRAQFLPLAAAVEECTRDGDGVAMEGFTHLMPFAAGHELIRQRLTLYRMTRDLIYDHLSGMGGAERLVCSWVSTSVVETPAPTTQELGVLRALQERTKRAHAA